MILYEVAAGEPDRLYHVFTRDRDDRFALRALCYTRHWPCLRITASKANREDAISVLEFERRENLL